MAEAFTAGVKMGGLTNDTEIRILLCYLIKSVGPVTREAMEAALLQEELVNYFEFVGALNDLVAQGLAIEGTNEKPGLFFVYLMVCNDDKMVTLLSVLP